MGDTTNTARTLPTLVDRANIGRRRISILRDGDVFAIVMAEGYLFSWGDNSKGTLGDTTNSTLLLYINKR